LPVSPSTSRRPTTVPGSPPLDEPETLKPQADIASTLGYLSGAFAEAIKKASGIAVLPVGMIVDSYQAKAIVA
jgi:hypothetical protein